MSEINLDNRADCDLLQHVGMGEVKVGRRAGILQATLGSCVGIAFIWNQGGRCGLAHCLLPESPSSIGMISARYVSEAVPSLLRLMRIKDSERADVQVILAGGASMFPARSVGNNIGQMNIAAAEKYLQQYGMQVVHADVGGRRGRQIRIDCGTQEYSIKQIARQPEEFEHGWI